MITTDFDNAKSFDNCAACGGSGKLVSSTTITRHAGERHFNHVRRYVPCGACAGTGASAAGSADAVVRIINRRLLDHAAQARIVQRLRQYRIEEATR